MDPNSSLDTIIPTEVNPDISHPGRLSILPQEDQSSKKNSHVVPTDEPVDEQHKLSNSVAPVESPHLQLIETDNEEEEKVQKQIAALDLPNPSIQVAQTIPTPQPKPDDDIQAKLLALFSDGAQRRKREAHEKIIRPKLMFLNTYQLCPEKPFIWTRVEDCIAATLKDIFKNREYNGNKAAALAGTTAEIIRDRVLAFGFDRYKYIVLVNIGPKASQGIEVGFQCLWNSRFDCYAKSTFESCEIFASACIFAIYYD